MVSPRQNPSAFVSVDQRAGRPYRSFELQDLQTGRPLLTKGAATFIESGLPFSALHSLGETRKRASAGTQLKLKLKLLLKLTIYLNAQRAGSEEPARRTRKELTNRL